MNTQIKQIITLILAIIIALICYGPRIKSNNKIVKFTKTRKHKKKKPKITIIKDSDISTQPITGNQDIRYEKYLNSAWDEIDKK